jgi:hypothetical protein
MRELHTLRWDCRATVSGGEGVVAQPVVRFLACAGLLAGGLLMGCGIASADPAHGGLGIGQGKDNDNKPRNVVRQTFSPVVRIGAREDRGGFEARPGGIRISRQPGFRGGFDTSPDAPRLTIDKRGISGAFNLGPTGSRVTLGSAWSGASREQLAQADTELSPSGTGDESEQASAKVPGVGGAAMPQQLTIYIPVPRMETGTGARARSSFTIVVISVPTGSILRGYGQPQPQPQPEPTPSPSLSPSFRISEVPTEQPNVEVIDATGQRGSDYTPAVESPPITAPVVIAPPPVAPPRPVAPPSAPPGIPPVPVAPPPAGGRPGGQVHVPTSIIAGGPPRMREPAPTPAPPPATGAVPVDLPATRVGYQQYLRTAKMTHVAVVALPGAAGLVLMTLSGTVIGYRQARAGHVLRHNPAARFMA